MATFREGGGVDFASSVLCTTSFSCLFFTFYFSRMLILYFLMHFKKSQVKKQNIKRWKNKGQYTGLVSPAEGKIIWACPRWTAEQSRCLNQAGWLLRGCCEPSANIIDDAGRWLAVYPHCFIGDGLKHVGLTKAGVFLALHVFRIGVPPLWP